MPLTATGRPGKSNMEHMMNYLIYSEVSLNGDHVGQRLGELDKSASVKVMVPVRALRAGELAFFAAELAGDKTSEPPPQLFARWRLRDAISALHRLGFESVEGVAVDKHPVDAIEAAVAANRYDSVIVVTERAGVAGWVHLDLAHRVERHLHSPVVHIELHPVH